MEENERMWCDDTKQKLAANRQRLFANFQYDWINRMWVSNEYKNDEPNVSTERAF